MPAGIAVQINRQGAPVEPDQFDSLVAALAHRGPDGCSTHLAGPVAFVQQRFFITPRRDPLPYRSADGSVFVLLAGRLDHPEDLAGVAPGAAADAERILAAYRRYGEPFIDQLRGSLVAIVVDLAARKVVAARDALGKQALYCHVAEELLLLASEPQALVRHPAVRGELDQDWLADYFALGIASDPGERTPFRGVTALAPGETLVWTERGVRRWRSRPAIGQRRLSYRRDQDYADHFYELLRRSVARAVLGNGDIGVMLSGGLDSCPVACLAAPLLRDAGQSLRAYSWSLPRFPEADETAPIRVCAAFAGIPLTRFEADDLALFDPVERWPIDPNTPLANPFLRLFLRTYEAAARDRRRILLQGTFADVLYPEYRYWLTEAVRDRQFALALRELAGKLRQRGLPVLWRDPGMRHFLKRLLCYPGRPRRPPAWLTPWAAARLARAGGPEQAPAHPRPDQYLALLGAGVFDQQVGHGYFQHRQGVVRTDPYHDWELIDFMLSVPAYQCYRQAQDKHLARLALRGRMPETLRVGPRTGLLHTLFDYGFNQSRPVMARLLADGSCSWPAYVKESVVFEALAGKPVSDQHKLVVWQAAAYELWRRELERQGLLG